MSGRIVKRGRHPDVFRYVGLLSLTMVVVLLLLSLWAFPHWAKQVARFCQLTLSEAAHHLPSFVLLVPPALLSLVILRSGWSFCTQIYTTRTLMRSLALQRSLSLPPLLARIAYRLGLSEQQLCYVKSDRPWAFCEGLLRPKIWFSSALVSLLDEAELAAVLRHERHHLTRKDPLCLVIGRALVSGLFFLPRVSSLFEHYRLDREITADEASASGGGAEKLVSALLKLLRAEASRHLSFEVGLLSDVSIITLRVKCLLGTSVSLPEPVFPLRLAATMLLVLIVFLALLRPLTSVADLHGESLTCRADVAFVLT